MGYDPYVVGGDKGMYKRDWIGHAARFFNRQVRGLDGLAPHNELTGPGCYCLANPGREYVVYATIGSAVTFNLNLTASTNLFLCRFYDPRTGQFASSFQRQGGATVSFTRPDANDWVLHLTSGIPGASLSPTTVNVREGGAHDTYQVVLNAEPWGSVTIAVTPDSQVTVDKPMLTFTVGNWNQPQTVTVTAVDDSIPEGHHVGHISHVLNGGGAYDGVAVSDVTADIADNEIPGDCDGDGDVDQSDFGCFQRCLSGEWVSYKPSCGSADLDIDGDVDLNDFQVFLSCMRGADVIPDPDCGHY